MDYGVQANIWGRIRVQTKRYLAAIRRIWWLLPLTISLGTCIAAWVVAQMPPAYQSTGRMVYAGQYNTLGNVYSEQLSNYFGTQIQLMLSPQVRQDALNRVQTLHPELKPEEPSFKVSQIPQASMFILQVTAKSPVFAQAYLDGAMEAYLDEKKRLREDLSGATTAGLTKEMSHLEQVMAQNEVEMLAFEKQHNVGFLEQEDNNAAKYLDQLNQQLSELKSNYDLLSMMDLDQSLDQSLQRQQAPVASAAPAADGTAILKTDTALSDYGPIADYQKARQEIALLKSQLSDMSHRLKPKHPDMIALNLQIQRQEDIMATLRTQSQEEMKTHRAALGVQIKNLENQIEDQQKAALALSGTLAEFNHLKTKSDRAKAEYDRLLSDYHTVDVSKNVEQDPLNIFQHASPAVSVKPGLEKIFFAGLGGGLFIGLIALFIIDQTDDRISSLMEMQTHFPEQLLGQIPEEKFQQGRALLKADDDRQALLESFRTLRSSIIFLPVEGKRPKTIAVTSALPDEGKTTVSANLAITLAFSGARTLIVDADLRRGQVSHVFGATECNGFSSLLLQKKTWKECVFETSTKNLFILPCGPALQHTSEHLLGKVTDQFLQTIYDQFDYVIFDSPPVIILDDTLCLAPKIDATLFVVRFNTSSVRSSRRALELLNNRQVNVIGVVCNGVTISETEYNYNYNYRQYGNRYAEKRPDDSRERVSQASA
jgi:capsular exopolysaccharide synthesis family protein